jgi:ferritin
MISKRMQDEMNQQIKHEAASAYLYMSMAAYFHSKSLDGMAQWMTAQAQEEVAHAMRFYAHINERGGRVELQAIDKPASDWATPLDAFKASLAHEQFITGRIDELVRVAREESDNAAGIMLQWFVSEQVEEEATVSTVVDMLSLIGDSGHGLLMADRELGARTYVPPATEEA